MKRADGTKDFCIEKNYRNNDALRASFNRLAEKLMEFTSLPMILYLSFIQNLGLEKQKNINLQKM